MRFLRVMVPVVALLAVGEVWAQEPIDVGGMTVARIRDRGSYESVTARVAQIDRWIADVISYENTQSPKLSLARKDGVLRVYCGTRPVIDVFPADAAASNTTEMALAQMWLKNLKTALPRSTPVSRLPARTPPAGTPAAGPTAPGVPTVPGGGESSIGSPAIGTPAGGEPSTGLAERPPGSSTQPTGETLPPVPDETLTPPAKTPRSAALLMVLEALGMARVLPEDEYLAGRDALAANLLENLEPFMAQVREAGEASGTPAPPRPPREAVTPLPPVAPPPPTPPTTPPTTPPAVTPLPPAGGTGGSVVPRVPTVPSVPSAPTGGAVTAPPTAPVAGDPNTARVPQKQRIKRKFAAAQEPFWALKNAGDPKAEEVGRLLTESRTAHTDGDFDTAEAKIDEALRLMGIPIPN